MGYDYEDEIDLGAVPTALAVRPRVARAPVVRALPRQLVLGPGGGGGQGLGTATYALGTVSFGATDTTVTETFTASRRIRPHAVYVGIVDTGAAAGKMKISTLAAGDDTLKPGGGPLAEESLVDPLHPARLLPKIIEAGTPIAVTIVRSAAPGTGYSASYIITFDADILD